MEIKTDLEIAFDAIGAKQPAQNSLFAYYDGTQPAVYSGQHLKDLLGGKAKDFSQNWCGVVIDSVLDRLNLNGFGAEDEALVKAMTEIWNANELDLESDSVHEAALVAGEAFLIIWPDPDKENSIEAYYNDPRLCHVAYDQEKPRVKVWAAKRWLGSDGHIRMTVYYPDHLEYWRSAQPADQVTNAKGFLPMDPPTAANSYGEVPVFHFRSQRRRVQSDLTNVVSLQDAVNILLTDMLATAEYAAFPMRYIISSADIEELKNAPNRIWSLPPGEGGEQPTSAGQFPAADLANYLEAMDKLATSIGVITHTPKHYFFGQGGSNLSGEALIAMEAPLNKKVADRVEVFLPTWRRAMTFALKVAGATVDPLSILPQFDEPETIQPRTAAEIMTMRVTAGMPLKSALRLEGMEETEIEQIETERAEERTAQQPRRLGLNEAIQPVAQEGE